METDDDKIALYGCTVPASKETDYSHDGCTVGASKIPDSNSIALGKCTVDTAAVTKEQDWDCTEITAKETTGDCSALAGDVTEPVSEGYCIKPTVKESARVFTELAGTMTGVDKVHLIVLQS